MEDTDWRCSPCPSCGEIREAAKDPVCLNSVCTLYKLSKENVVDKLSKPKTPKVFSTIQMYQSPDGKTHLTKKEAVAHMVKECLSQAVTSTGPEMDQTINTLAQRMVDQPMKSEIMSLLKELGA